MQRRLDSSSDGEQTFSPQQNQARHLASRSFDASSSPYDFTSSLRRDRGPAIEREHSSQRQVIRQGANSSFDESIPMHRTTGGGNNDDQVFVAPYTPALPTASPPTEGPWPARQASRHHRPSTSFDANENLQLHWELEPLQMRKHVQARVLNTLGTIGPSRPSQDPRQEQTWYQMQQSSRWMGYNGGIDRSGGSSGGTFTDRSFCPLERLNMSFEGNGESSPTERKRKRLPYRCK